MYCKSGFLYTLKFLSLRKIVSWIERYILISPRKSVFPDTVLLMNSCIFLVYGHALIFFRLLKSLLWIWYLYSPFNLLSSHRLAFINSFFHLHGALHLSQPVLNFWWLQKIPYRQNWPSVHLLCALHLDGLVHRNQLIKHGLPNGPTWGLPVTLSYSSVICSDLAQLALYSHWVELRALLY